MKKYRNVKLYDENKEDLDASVRSILEARKLVELSDSEAGSNEFGGGSVIAGQ